MSSASPHEFIEVSTATDTEAAALDLGRRAVEARLAAGAQVTGPVKSVFWHAGEFGVGEEWRLLLRTRADLFDRLAALLVEHHPWKNPEVLALRITAGTGEYLDWINRTVANDSQS